MNEINKQRIERRLNEINSELEQLDYRLSVAHGLGDSNSTQGISTSYNDNKYWTARRDALRRERNKLESMLAGESGDSVPFINQGVFRPL